MTDADPLRFDDNLLDEALAHPDWFRLSLGDLRDDVAEARAAGKRGLIVYFGQARCAYCEKFFDINLADTEIERYLRQHFDIVPVDIWGIDEFIDTDGKAYTERELALHYQVNFTPSLIFYDRGGKPVFRLRGYYPPYQFHAVLHYIAEGFHRVESYRDYFARAEPSRFFTEGDLIEREFFAAPPHDLARAGGPGSKPLAVIFEKANCHACEILHSGPLSRTQILAELGKMDVIQLDLHGDSPIVTPDGKSTTASQWGRDLELFYTPSIVLFSPEGKEVMRVDSVVQFYRLWGVLDFVNRRGYASGIDYQQWRLKARETID